MDVDEQEKRAEYLKLIGEIAYLAFAVNEFTEYYVFFELAGHVGHVRLEIASSKENYNDKIAGTEFYTRYQDPSCAWKMVQNGEQKAKRDQLANILDEGELPYHDMTPVHETHTRYQF